MEEPLAGIVGDHLDVDRSQFHVNVVLPDFAPRGIDAERPVNTALSEDVEAPKDIRFVTHGEV